MDRDPEWHLWLGIVFALILVCTSGFKLMLVIFD